MEELKINKSEFHLLGPDDELRVDQLCRQLLRRFYDQLLADGIDPALATAWASGADYFLRDFIVDRKRGSIFEEPAGVVRQFAGNWYIVTTLEPNMGELAPMLAGVKEFYRFLAAAKLVSDDYLKEIEAECDLEDYYRERIESFWKISGDGFAVWDRECSLK